MLTIEQKKVKSQCIRFRMKSIKRVYVEDDVLKIEYLNKNGVFEDVFINGRNNFDLFDVEYFLVNVIDGYVYGKFDAELLQWFGKTLYDRLIPNIEQIEKGFGKLKNINFARFIIEQAFIIISQTYLAQDQENKILNAHIQNMQFDNKRKLVLIQYLNNQESSKDINRLSNFLIKENTSYDLRDFKDFYVSCFPEIDFDSLTFDYAKRLCRRLYSIAVQESKI